EVAGCESDRLRSYVRSVVAVAHLRCQDGFRDTSSKQYGGIEHHWVPRSVSRLGIDRSHHLLVSSKLPAYQEGDAALPVKMLSLPRFRLRSCFMRCDARATSGMRSRALGRGSIAPLPGSDCAVTVVALAADHQLPGDARRLIGERHGGKLRRLALDERQQPGRGLSAPFRG